MNNYYVILSQKDIYVTHCVPFNFLFTSTNKTKLLSYSTNRFRVAVRLFGNHRSQMMSKCGKDTLKRGTRAIRQVCHRCLSSNSS